MPLEIDVQKIAKEFSVEIKLVNLNKWRARVWVAQKLFQLAGWLMWADVEFIEDEDKAL